jgi:hypothetical protein
LRRGDDVEPSLTTHGGFQVACELSVAVPRGVASEAQPETAVDARGIDAAALRLVGLRCGCRPCREASAEREETDGTCD